MHQVGCPPGHLLHHIYISPTHYSTSIPPTTTTIYTPPFQSLVFTIKCTQYLCYVQHRSQLGLHLGASQL